MSIVRVALDVPISTLFDYTVDETDVTGMRVVVPFGRRQMEGTHRQAFIARHETGRKGAVHPARNSALGDKMCEKRVTAPMNTINRLELLEI